MTLLEIQVADLREDVTVVQDEVSDIETDVDFLFDEQIIQDERLLNLEETSLQVVVELAEVNVNLLGKKKQKKKPLNVHLILFGF